MRVVSNEGRSEGGKDEGDNGSEREERVRSQEETVNRGTKVWQERSWPRKGCYSSELPLLALSCQPSCSCLGEVACQGLRTPGH